MSDLILVTGGAGYVGAALVEELLEAGRDVRVLDRSCHGQRAVADVLRQRGAEVRQADMRDEARAPRGARGRGGAGAPGRDRRRSRLRAGSRALPGGERRAHPGDHGRGPRRRRARTWCSPRPARTTAAWPIRPCRSTRTASSRPSRSTPSRRWRWRRCCCPARPAPMAATCLRFATVYGVAPRMRFDLTVNEFTRDLWADRDLEVFGEQFWRPYVHVRDAGPGRPHGARGRPRAHGRPRSSTSATPTRTTASSTWWRSSARRSPAAG